VGVGRGVARADAGQRREVVLGARAAHADARALVVGPGPWPGQVAGDGRWVVGDRRRLVEVDGRGGDSRRVATGGEQRAEDRRGGAPHEHGGGLVAGCFSLAEVPSTQPGVRVIRRPELCLR
jgi:hypothetical protein